MRKALDSAKLIVRQNEDSNGFETWRRPYKMFSQPGATRSTTLLTQLLDFKFNPATFEQDLNVWETIKSRQSGQPLRDGVLVLIYCHSYFNAQTCCCEFFRAPDSRRTGARPPCSRSHPRPNTPPRFPWYPEEICCEPYKPCNSPYTTR